MATATAERAWVLNEPDGTSKAFHGWENLTGQPLAEAWTAWPLVICERDRERVVGEWLSAVAAGKPLDTRCWLSNGRHVRAKAKPITLFDDDQIEFFLGIISPVELDAEPPKSQLHEFLDSLDPFTRAQLQMSPFFHLHAAPRHTILGRVVGEHNFIDYRNTKATRFGSGTGAALPHVSFARGSEAMKSCYVVLLPGNEVVEKDVTQEEAQAFVRTYRAAGGTRKAIVCVDKSRED